MLEKEPANKDFDVKARKFRTKITPQLATHKNTVKQVVLDTPPSLSRGLNLHPLNSTVLVVRVRLYTDRHRHALSQEELAEPPHA